MARNIGSYFSTTVAVLIMVIIDVKTIMAIIVEITVMSIMSATYILVIM